LNWRFWTWFRRKKGEDEHEIKNVRTINDIQIHVSTGLSGTRDVKISGWNEPMTEGLFWKIWDGLTEREK
jgi:hypothetical protein